MPTVPVGRRRVEQAPLSGARVVTDAPTNTFGGPVDTGPALDTVTAAQYREKQRADQVMNNRNELAAAAVRTRAQNAAMALKGVGALKAMEKAREEWDKGISEVETGITDERQLEMFRLRSEAHWQDVQHAVQRHADQEFTAEDERSTKALSVMADDEAVQSITDPARVAGAIAKKRATWTDYGGRMGWTPEAIKAKVADEVSATHSAVLASLLNNEQDMAAADYFKANKKEFAGKDLITAEKLVDVGSVRGMSQRNADKILAQTATLHDALAATKQIVEPRVRDETEARVRREFADRAADERFEQEQAFNEASALLEKTGDFSKIPIGLRVKLSPAQNGSLQHREDQIRHPKEAGDAESYFQLMNLAGLPSSRDEFLSENLATGYPKLSPAQRTRLMTLQRTMSGKAETEDRRDTGAAVAAEKLRFDRESALLKVGDPASSNYITDPKERAAEVSRIKTHYDLLARAHGGTPTAPAPSAGMTAPAKPSNPLEGVLTPLQKPTRAMLADVAAKGPRYAEYLRHMGYEIP